MACEWRSLGHSVVTNNVKRHKKAILGFEIRIDVEGRIPAICTDGSNYIIIVPRAIRQIRSGASEIGVKHVHQS